MSRRGREEFSELIPKYALKTRYEEVADLASYAHKLSYKDKKWLNDFAKEYISASFSKDPTKHLHNTDELRKSCYNRNNHRNSDIFTQHKAMGTMNYLEDILILKTRKDEEGSLTVINEDSDNLFEMFEEKEIELEDAIKTYSSDRLENQEDK